MSIHVVTISSAPVKPFSLPLGTFLVRAGDGGNMDCNQTLDSAGVLMEKGDTMEGKCLIIVGGPPPSWFAGLGITSTTMQPFGRRQS